MGGRGNTSGIQKNRIKFSPHTYGQITKMEAGQLYKAVKNDKVKALPETVSMLYDEANKMIKFASERYSQDFRFYDRVSKLTEHLLNEDYKSAQKIITEIEKDMIKRAGKKSKYYKYKKQS